MNQQLNIFDYMDPILFLKDYYEVQKSLNTEFSYYTWSVQLGFSNKTLLRLIIYRKRKLTAKSAQLFKKYFGWQANECEYFDRLVDYIQAISSEQKRLYSMRLIQLQRQNSLQVNIDADSGILKDAYGPIILTALAATEKPLKIGDLVSKLNISELHVKLVLDSLLFAELIYCESDYYFAKNKTFKISDHYGHQGLKTYYQYWIEKSIQAIELPYELRRFRSLQLALSEEEFQTVVSMFNDFALQILGRYETNSLNSERTMYLLNTELFPVQGEINARSKDQPIAANS